MKKKYIQPSAVVILMRYTTVICLSDPVHSVFEYEDVIGYGGYDVIGDQDPASRLRHRTVWDYDEEEEEEF